MAPDAGSPFVVRPLGEIFRLENMSIIPGGSPTEVFIHHSIPAFDEMAGPVLNRGMDIESNKTLLSRPCVLVSKLNPRKPRVSVVDPSNSPLRHCASTEFMVFVPRSNNLSLRFFGWYLASAGFHRRLEQVATGTTNSHVRAKPSETLTWGVPVPPLPEQRRIVEILDTLDESIRKTEQLVAKLKRMKQGLFHDLLTRGIDDNGELRDPERHPEQFKKSLLGQIPREWDIVLFGKILANRGGLLQTGPFGSQLHAHEYVQGAGIPVVMPQDIGDTNISVKEIARILPRRADQLSRHKMAVNDVVFARRGDLSRCAAIQQREAGWICGTGCLLARLPTSVMRAQWFSALYRHDWLQRQIARRAVGSTMVNLNAGILAGLLIPLPLIAEQARIAEVIQGLELRCSAESEHLRKLRLLRLGLMEDLLTGRVPVTPLLAGFTQ